MIDALIILIWMLALLATVMVVAIVGSWVIFLIAYLRGENMDRTLGQIVEGWCSETGVDS